MKKIINFILFLSINIFTFAFPNKLYLADNEHWFEIKNHTLYNDGGEIVANIKDDKLYDTGDIYIGTLIEDTTNVSLNLFENDKAIFCFDFDGETGFMTKAVSYTDGTIDSIVIYTYEKERLTKTTLYNSENIVIGYEEYLYDKKSGNRTKTINYDENNRLKTETEFDSKTGKIIKILSYNEDASLRRQTTFDRNTENPIERLVYTANSKKPTKWTFLQFDEEGKYSLGDSFYLSSTMCKHWQLVVYAEKSQETPIDWNDNYSAVIRKHEFTKTTDGYIYIANLKEKHYLSSTTITLCNKKSNTCYCFSTDENDEIDISSCYEIEFIKKAADYSTYRKDKGIGVFGFSIGMTYDEVKEACGGSEPEHIADNRYIVKPKKSHPLFEKYIVWISDSVGLYYIKGISRDISTTSYGTEVKNKFNDLLSSLEKKYGKFKMTDTVKSDYYLKDNQYWMSAMRDGARTYQANWNATEDNFKDFNGVMSIAIGIKADYSISAYIWIEYAFLNALDAEQEKDDVL